MISTKVTILIPLYNKEKYLDDCLKSILKQKTNFLYHIIIIDDGSTDKSFAIASNYKNKYPKKINLIKNEENIGLCLTTIKGYENLNNSDYFCVLDPDDYWVTDDKLQKAIDVLEKHKEFTIYFTNSYIFYESKNKKENFLSVPHEKFIFTINDYFNNQMPHAHTSSTIFRNIAFNAENIKRLKKIIDINNQKSFEGDSFRNLLHLSFGKAYFENNITSVYRITDSGVWTTLSKFDQNCVNSKFNLDMILFFPQFDKNYFLERNIFYNLDNLQLINKKEKINNSCLNNFCNILSESLKHYVLISNELKIIKEPNFSLKSKNKNLREKFFAKLKLTGYTLLLFTALIPLINKKINYEDIIRKINKELMIY